MPRDIVPVLSNELADDIAFIITKKTIEKAELLMQDAINCFSEWCKKVKLNINVQKTKTMCFTTKRDNIPDLKLNGETIETVNKF